MWWSNGWRIYEGDEKWPYPWEMQRDEDVVWVPRCQIIIALSIASSTAEGLFSYKSTSNSTLVLGGHITIGTGKSRSDALGCMLVSSSMVAAFSSAVGNSPGISISLANSLAFVIVGASVAGTLSLVNFPWKSCQWPSAVSWSKQTWSHLSTGHFASLKNSR